MKEEEERIKLKEEIKGDQCMELPSSFVTNENLSNNPIEILTDYPHVCLYIFFLLNTYLTFICTQWQEINKYRHEMENGGY